LPKGKKDDQKLELAAVFCPRGKKSHFTPYNQGVKLLISHYIQVVQKNFVILHKEIFEKKNNKVGKNRRTKTSQKIK
jgi:hypothetical protein